MLTGPSYFRRSCPRTRHRRRSARSSERLGFKESKADISASTRRDLKQSDTPSPTLLPAKRCGSTRSFRRGLTTAVTRKTLSRSMRCSTISVSIGSQIPQRRRPGYIGKIPSVVVQASPRGASSCRCPHQSSRGRFFVRQKEWAEVLWPNLFYWNELDKGGHFAAFEQPQLFAGEMRNAFKSRRG